MKVENITYLKNKFPSKYEKIQDIKENKDENIIIDKASNNEKSLYLKKNLDEIRIHSMHNPSYEAEIIINGYKDIEESDHILIYGVGLGYLLKYIKSKYPNKKLYIIEPIASIFYALTEEVDLNKLNIENILIGNDKEEMTEFLSNAYSDVQKNLLVIEMPSYKHLFKEDIEKFNKLFRDIISLKRSGIHTNYAFQKRWISNSMMNFKEVLSTPNILLQDTEAFKGKPAILVAAGPSLDEEIENLRHIKENGLAYIFSVGSAINTLIEHDIFPDAACAYDPTEENMKVFTKLKNRTLNIPLIFGSSIGFKTLEDYPGKKIHMLTSQDTLAKFYLKAKFDEEIEGVMDAPSIAVVTLQLLYKLGFQKVILVGQNLGYKEEKTYASGIDYHNNKVDDLKVKNALRTKDVYGNDILTNQSFNRMREQIEMYVEQFKDLEVINATKGGANIKGTKFTLLDNLIKKDLTKKAVDDNWKNFTPKLYDVSYLQKKAREMDKSKQDINHLITGLNSTLKKIESLVINKNFKQAERMYGKLDKDFKSLTKNYYFSVFIIPMNRVHYEILSNELLDSSKEKNKIHRAEKVINSVSKFIFICKRDMKSIECIYVKIRSSINMYLKLNSTPSLKGDY